MKKGIILTLMILFMIPGGIVFSAESINWKELYKAFLDENRRDVNIDIELDDFISSYALADIDHDGVPELFSSGNRSIDIYYIKLGKIEKTTISLSDDSDGWLIIMPPKDKSEPCVYYAFNGLLFDERPKAKKYYKIEKRGNLITNEFVGEFFGNNPALDKVHLFDSLNFVTNGGYDEYLREFYRDMLFDREIYMGKNDLSGNPTIDIHPYAQFPVRELEELENQANYRLEYPGFNKDVTVWNSDLNLLMVDGFYTDMAIYNSGDKFYLPLRYICENYKMAVEWNPITESITIKSYGKEYELVRRNEEYLYSGKKIDTKLISDSLYVSSDLFAEFGLEVSVLRDFLSCSSREKYQLFDAGLNKLGEPVPFTSVNIVAVESYPTVTPMSKEKAQEYINDQILRIKDETNRKYGDLPLDYYHYYGVRFIFEEDIYYHSKLGRFYVFGQKNRDNLLLFVNQFTGEIYCFQLTAFDSISAERGISHNDLWLPAEYR